MGEWEFGFGMWVGGGKSEQQGVMEFSGLLQQFKMIEGGLDRWVWKRGSGGEFSASSACTEFSKQGGVVRLGEQQWKLMGKVWKTFVPIKAQVTAWRLLRNGLPMMDNLRKRFDGICCCCKLVERDGQASLPQMHGGDEAVVQDGSVGRGNVGSTSVDRPSNGLLGRNWEGYGFVWCWCCGNRKTRLDSSTLNRIL